MSTYRLFVTGLDGFVGTKVRETLLKNTDGYPFQLITPEEPYNLKEKDSILNVIRKIKPDFVLHLAGQSSVPASFEDPKETHLINFIGTLNLIESLKEIDFSGSMVYVSSGEVYGRVEVEDMPVTEDHTLRPHNPYSVSKVAAEFLCKQYVITDKMKIVIARPFNHVGPGQSERFAVSSFAKQVMEIKLGLRTPEMQTGNLSNSRDFTDVRDVVDAYLKLLISGRSGEVYNICSGNEYSMSEILQKMFEISGVKCNVSTDFSRLRSNEQNTMCGSYKKIKDEVGWSPTINIDRSLSDALDKWKEELA
jgi:GDP-4-dehydro-6-deoxy-D-mannose reductase